jgi:hypothetical protein
VTAVASAMAATSNGVAEAAVGTTADGTADEKAMAPMPKHAGPDFRMCEMLVVDDQPYFEAERAWPLLVRASVWLFELSAAHLRKSALNSVDAPWPCSRGEGQIVLPRWRHAPLDIVRNHRPGDLGPAPLVALIEVPLDGLTMNTGQRFFTASETSKVYLQD